MCFRGPNIMPLISLVDESIKLCKVEEARIIKNIIQCKEILRALRPQQENHKEKELADVGIDPDVVPEERQEMELVNKMLEKALRVRRDIEPYKAPPNFTGPKKVPGDTTQGKERTLVLDYAKGNKTAIKSTSRSIALDIKESTKSSASHPIRGGRGKMCLQMHPSGQARASMIRVSVHTQKPSVTLSKRLPPQSSRKVVKQTGPLCPLSHEGPIKQAFSSGHLPQCVVSHRSLFGEDSGKPSAMLVQPRHGGDLGAVVSEAMGEVHDASAPLNSMLSRWSSLRNKQSRLWDKVLAQQSKPSTAKTHFTERVRSTFAKDWPACGSQCDTRVQVDRLTLLCRDLTHRCQSERLLSHQTTRATDSEPGTYDDGDYESLLMLEGLEKMVADLCKCAAQLRKGFCFFVHCSFSQKVSQQCEERLTQLLTCEESGKIHSNILTLFTVKTTKGHVTHKPSFRMNPFLNLLGIQFANTGHTSDSKKWEAWDRWRSPRGDGAFCGIRKRVGWGEPGGVTLLPQTLTYTSQEELQEVERLRMRVELLQQEVHLQQAFSDNVVMLSTPGPYSPSVLRDIYSLLVEGGVQFPALVLDTEPD